MKKASKQFSKRLRSLPRERYPDEEAKHPWLSILLDTYHVVDVGISVELEEEQKKRKSKLACHKGCSNCCLRPEVPITPLEQLGISWFAKEKLEGQVREEVKKQLLSHRQSLQCPFLVDSLCSIYRVRPIACRMFFVFGEPCGLGEQLQLTRPEDIWTHSINVARRVAMTVLPYYGIIGKRKKLDAFENGYIASISIPMHEVSWEGLYRKMD